MARETVGRCTPLRELSEADVRRIVREEIEAARIGRGAIGGWPNPYEPCWPYGPAHPLVPFSPDYWFPDKTKTECLWEKMSPEDRMKPMGLSCPCPKCTPRC